MKKEKVCYCCNGKGAVKIPVGMSSVFYMCRSCFKSYKKSLEIIKNSMQK